MAELAVFCALGLVLFTMFVVWLQRQLRYRINLTHFEVLLFGLPLRRVRLEHIRSVSKRRPEGLSEYWYNTLHPSHRRLVIRLSRGLRRNLVISPRNRYILKTDLEHAVASVTAESGTAPNPGSRSVIITD